ncbi:MAG: KamA family radical SAM protein [Candidatus Muiribacteriota bacterium]
MINWKEQIENFVNTKEKLKNYINLTEDEEKAIDTLKTKWGTTPYFASLMDKDDPECPIRKQVVPSMTEKENKYGMDNYLLWKENRETEEKRPDSIARQYVDKVAFTVCDYCGIYCRHCFRKELVVDTDLKLRFDFDEGIEWIRKTPEVRDILITGGDPFLLPDEQIEYIINKLREIPHIEMIRFGSRAPVVLPHRITDNLLNILGKDHKVPIWLNTQVNSPKELTEEVRQAVLKLLRAGVNVGNQAVLLKGINDDDKTFKKLHLKLLQWRIKPYYVFYCEPAPGIDHFRTPVLRGAELIRDNLRGHTTGLAIPMYVIATNVGKVPLMPDYYIEGVEGDKVVLKNHKGQKTYIPNI